jgi:hypothetical protein
MTMPSKISTIERLARQRLVEAEPRFWSSQELTDIIIAGIRDLWRDIVDLKQEHFFKTDPNVTYEPETTQLTNVPLDVHKLYLIEAQDLTTTSSNVGLQFKPKDYNHNDFQLARSRGAIDPANDTFYYCITKEGGPVNAPVIRVAPKTSSTVRINFSYCPTLGDFESDSYIPIPGECDNALIAWCVAYARGKESESRAPDPVWLQIYSTEKSHLLESLGLRQYQEPIYVDALWQEYW